MKTKQELVWEAHKILRELGEKHPHLAAKLVPIQFVVSARMTSAAGTAYPKRNLIKLSLAYFASDENFAKEFRNVVTHEIAHILVPPVRLPGRRNRDSHGPQWQLMHRSLGGTGERCHTLDLAVGFAARRQSPRQQVPCPCGCGQTMSLGPTQYRTHQSGRQYYIRGHRPRKYRGFRLPFED